MCPVVMDLTLLILSYSASFETSQKQAAVQVEQPNVVFADPPKHMAVQSRAGPGLPLHGHLKLVSLPPWTHSEQRPDKGGMCTGRCCQTI